MRALSSLLVLPLIACGAPPAPSSPSSPSSPAPSTPSAGVEIAFRLPDEQRIPEGIAHDPVTGDFFVGSTYRRSIARVAPDGTVRDLVPSGQGGLLGVVGMTVDPQRRVLWAANSNAGVHMPMVVLPTERLTPGASALDAYDLTTGRLVRRLALPAEPPHFLNDLVIDPAGDVWVTDSLTGTVYRAGAGDTLEPAIALGQPGANGIALAPDGHTAFVAMPDHYVRVDLRTREHARVDMAPGTTTDGSDGLYLHDGALFSVEPWRRDAEVVRYRLDAGMRRIVAMDVVLPGHPELEQPTTGVIVGDAMYLIANSHLQTFRRRTVGEARPDDVALRPTAVLRIPLAAPAPPAPQ